MRREDKNRLPPRLKVRLPPGYHLERVPDAYCLYLKVGFPLGTRRMTTLVYSFPADSTNQEIEGMAQEIEGMATETLT